MGGGECPLCPSTGRGPAGTRKWEKNRGQEELREEEAWEGLSLKGEIVEAATPAPPIEQALQYTMELRKG